MEASKIDLLSSEGLRQYAKKIGTEGIEIYIYKEESLSIKTRCEALERFVRDYTKGYGIRVSFNNSFGFSTTSIEKEIEAQILSAKKNAKIKGRDEWWKGFIKDYDQKDKYSLDLGIYDKKVEELDEEDMMEFVDEINNGIGSIKGVNPVSNSIFKSNSKIRIINSEGIDKESETTMIYGFSDVIISNDKNNSSSAYEFDVSHNNNIDFFKIGENAAKMAKESMNGKKIDSKEYDIILCPFAVSDLFDNIFVNNIKGDEVLKGRSHFTNDIGSSVSNAGLNIVDNGLYYGGIGSSLFDDEGVNSLENIIIDDGILKGFIYDNYTAGKIGKKSTGNAIRDSYASIPRIDIRNLIINHKEKGNLIDETRDGILINSFIGAHTANEITGDFSLEGKNSFKIEDGELKYPIRSLMVYGNFFDLLNKTVMCGKDQRKIFNIITPSLLVKDVKVI
ncbi:MAG: TldD/PmbA family protein [Candidatus Methanoliparum thermophilum]|uniref:TldD/PmbA family protein n=1 Tax=Methanoliparum thermophilum TaxID=2491083 RepID=A0A520KQI1_METT2|nr:TldD/PmbA family protein [Candidatus Methanoliparum sp. LAM-1]RZN63822.1 MAG: TldD/PmbA family protein [Candidatus Methanoliparum thermophilum]BDC36454.1 PmbA protein [Candidatus Methanoliparum sp. LAM-1]